MTQELTRGMAAPPPPQKEEIGKHFQNGQRRHRDNEAELKASHGSDRTGDTPQSVAKANSRTLQGSSKTTPPTASTGQPSNSGAEGMTNSSQRNLPVPAGLDREHLVDMQRYPEHLREQHIFNRSIQRTNAIALSEEDQYRIEQNKMKARTILTNIADEEGIEEKVVERILESFERML